MLLATLLACSLGAQPLSDLRAEAEALVRIQITLGWYAQTVGEPSITALTYRGHEQLFSPKSIARVRKELARKDLSPGDRRRLEFFKAYLAAEAIQLRTAHFDDEAYNAELKATVSLPGDLKPTPYKELEVMLQNEKDAGRRTAIEEARAKVWKSTLNPLLAAKEAENQRLAKVLGYRSYLQLGEEVKRVDLTRLLAEGHAFLLRTDGLFRALLDEVSQKQLGVPASTLHRADIARLRNAPKLEKYFPKELEEPTFLWFLANVGLDMKTVARTNIVIDDSANPLKEPRAACFAVHVPDDVRISVKPSAGIEDFATLFHEGGHALHFANATTQSFELQQLGPNSITEAYAEVFGKVWGDPLWLRHYRDFVRQYNGAHHTAIPLLTDADITDLSHLRVYNDFYYLRRYGYAKLVYESVLHGADASVWKGVYAKPTGDPMEVYRNAFAEAYGISLTDADALRFRTDVDPLFYAADYARAFLLADVILEGLRTRYGGTTGDWYQNPEAGNFLRSLYAEGQREDVDEVAVKLGHARLDYGASEARARRLLGK